MNYMSFLYIFSNIKNLDKSYKNCLIDEDLPLMNTWLGQNPATRLVFLLFLQLVRGAECELFYKALFQKLHFLYDYSFFKELKIKLWKTKRCKNFSVIFESYK